MELHRTFEPPDTANERVSGSTSPPYYSDDEWYDIDTAYPPITGGRKEHPGLTEMKELERLARKRPCTMTSEQWKAYEEYQTKAEQEYR